MANDSGTGEVRANRSTTLQQERNNNWWIDGAEYELF